MALVLADRVKESSNSSGSGPFVLGGAAAGYQTVLAGIGNGNSSYFAAWDGAAKWLVFRGTFTSAGNSLSVDTVLAQSSGFTGFTSAFTIWGDSPAYLMGPLLQMIATAGQIEVTGKLVVDAYLGVGAGAATPLGSTQVLYVVNNVAGDSQALAVQNKSAAAGAAAGIFLVNDTGVGALMYVYSSTTANAGLSYRANGALFINTGNGGVTYGNNAAAAPIYFMTGNPGVGIAAFDANGNLGIGTLTPTVALEVSANVAGQAPYIRSRNLSTTGIATLQAYNDAGKSIQIMQFGSAVLSGNMNAPNRSMIYVDGTNGLAISVGSNAPLIFGTGNNEVARFDQAGNFGIGNPAPAQIFDILRSSNGGVVGLITNPNTGVAAYTELRAANAGSYVRILMFGANASNYAPYQDTAMITANGAGGLVLQTGGGTRPIMFQVNGAEVGRFDAAGNFGLGGLVTTAGGALDITKNIAGQMGVLFNNTNNGNSYVSLRLTNNQSNATFDIYSTGSSYTPAGMYKAQQAILVHYGIGGMIFNNLAVAPIVFGINNVYVGQISGSQQFIFGTRSGNAIYNNETLSVWGPAGNSTTCIATYQNGSSTINQFFRQDTVTSSYMCLFTYQGGGVGGISISTTNTAYATSSDLRMKENFKPAGDAGPIIDAIEVEEFDWTDMDTHESHGIVAQKLHKVYPLAVVKGSDILAENGRLERPWMYDPSKLVPLLIHEVQSLRKRIAQMDNRVSEITRRGVLH